MLSLSFAPAVDREMTEALALPAAYRLTAHRQQLVDDIQQYNQHAQASYLAEFTDNELAEYREHLAIAHGRDGRGAGWIRTSSEPAFVGRASRA